MKELRKLFERIIQKVNINLRVLEIDVAPFVQNLIPLDQMVKFHAFYGITPQHPLNLEFRRCALSGSYFLGRCRAADAILYKSDIRGDELKKKGDRLKFNQLDLCMSKDESIDIEDSLLIKTLVHNYSHDPETLEKFFITNTAATHYANIHGSPINGSFLGPFATVDLTTTNDCVIGAYAYVQAGEIKHLHVDPGTVWLRSPGDFNFMYRYPPNLLKSYISFRAGLPPQGVFMDFVEERKEKFEHIFNVVNPRPLISVPNGSSLDRFAVVGHGTVIHENVLVAQRAYLENARLGKGANAQENCYIINAHLEGNNVTAHGAKIIEADLGKNVFVGFNSFLRGQAAGRLTIGQESMVMPHTIIDIERPLTIPAGCLVWGLITDAADLESHSIPLKEFSRIKGKLTRSDLCFEGSGASFVSSFQHRIQHILEANGAHFDGVINRGHAQKNQNINFNTIQPYPDGPFKGLYPTILIQP